MMKQLKPHEQYAELTEMLTEKANAAKAEK